MFFLDTEYVVVVSWWSNERMWGEQRGIFLTIDAWFAPQVCHSSSVTLVKQPHPSEPRFLHL